jgi:hypothetical protein
VALWLPECALEREPMRGPGSRVRKAPRLRAFCGLHSLHLFQTRYCANTRAGSHLSPLPNHVRKHSSRPLSLSVPPAMKSHRQPYVAHRCACCDEACPHPFFSASSSSCPCVALLPTISILCCPGARPLVWLQEEYVEVAVVVGAHGVRGDLRLGLSTDQPEKRFKAGSRWDRRAPAAGPRGDGQEGLGPPWKRPQGLSALRVTTASLLPSSPR